MQRIDAAETLDEELFSAHVPARHGLAEQPEKDEPGQAEEQRNRIATVSIKQGENAIERLLSGLQRAWQRPLKKEVLPMPEHHRQRRDTT
jgi:hypothetical protein